MRFGDDRRISESSRFSRVPLTVEAYRPGGPDFDFGLLISLAAFLALAIFLIGDPAFASRLEASVKNASSTVLSIAQLGSGIGVAVGGLLMSIGWSSAGRQVLSGSAVGVVATFGGPALIEVVRSFF